MIPGLGRSPGEGNVYPLQYSGLENSMDYIGHGIARSQTQLSDFQKKKSFQVLLGLPILQTYFKNYWLKFNGNNKSFEERLAWA